MSTRTSAPSIAELRAITQPASIFERNSGEHWAGRLYMRRVSPYCTRLLLRTPLQPNAVTWLMIGAEDMTKGVVTPRPGTKAKGGPGIGLNGGGNTVVGSGDVLQILSADDGDLTGAHLVTEKPISVIGGHECAFVPKAVIPSRRRTGRQSRPSSSTGKRSSSSRWTTSYAFSLMCGP